MPPLAECFKQGGFFTYINLLCLAIAITLIVGRAVFFLRNGAKSPRAFLEQLRKLIQAGQIEKAMQLCQSTGALFAALAHAGVSRLGRGESAVSLAIEEALLDARPEFKKRIGVLGALAHLATLIGLLGTSSGLIGAFASFARTAAGERAQTVLAADIAAALHSAWLGLAIAISCLVGSIFLQQASQKQQQALDAFALHLKNLLLDSLREPRRPAADSDQPAK